MKIISVIEISRTPEKILLEVEYEKKARGFFSDYPDVVKRQIFYNIRFKSGEFRDNGESILNEGLDFYHGIQNEADLILNKL